MIQRKRFASLLLAATLCMSLLPSGALAATEWVSGTKAAINSITIGAHTFVADSHGNIVIGSSQMTKEAAETALQGGAVTFDTVPGTMAFPYNKLSEAKKLIVENSMLYPGGADMGDTDWPYFGDGMDVDGGINGLFRVGFSTAAPAVDIGMKSAIATTYSGAAMTGVMKYFVAPYDDADVPGYDKFITTAAGYKANKNPSGDFTYTPYSQVCEVYWKDEAVDENACEITGISTENIKLFAQTVGSGDAYVRTKNATEGTKLTAVQVADQNGTAITPTVGLSFQIGPFNTSGTASLTVKSTAAVPAGTYYVKVSEVGKDSVFMVASVPVQETLAVSLSVSPQVVADKLTLYLKDMDHSSILEISGTAYLPAKAKGSLNIKDASGKAYYLKSRPLDGETYGGVTYLFHHYEVKKSDVEDNTVLTTPGAVLNGMVMSRLAAGNQLFTLPEYAISITAVFTEAYHLTAGSVTGYDEGKFPKNVENWYRGADKMDFSSAIADANKQSQFAGSEVSKVTVYKTGDPNTVIKSATKEEGFTGFTFDMPTYPVSVDIAYQNIMVTTVASQVGTIIQGVGGQAQYQVTTINVPEGTTLQVKECTAWSAEKDTEGLALSITPIVNNAATVTVNGATAVPEGVYYFNLLTADGARVLTKNPVAITVDLPTTKYFAVGPQQGALAEKTPGSATYAGAANGIANDTAVVAKETDKDGTPLTVNPTGGLTFQATAVQAGAYTVTASITSGVKAGTYYFIATGDGQASAVATVVVGAAGSQTYTVTFAGGEGGTGTPPTQAPISQGAKINLPANPFVKDGHGFSGWSDGQKTYGAADPYTMGGANVSFIAQWLKLESMTAKDAADSLGAVTAENAGQYAEQINAAAQALSGVAENSALAAKESIAAVEKLYQAVHPTVTVTVTGDADLNVTQVGAVFSSGGTSNVALAVNKAEQQKPIPTEFADFTVVPLDIGLTVGGSAQAATTPIVITMDIPQALATLASGSIRALHYSGGANTPVVITPTVSGGKLSFAMKTFSPVYLVAAASGGTYLVSSETYSDGYVGISNQTPAAGETVTLTATPNSGYTLDTISVVTGGGVAVTLSGSGNIRTFHMPAENVTVKATFKESVVDATKYLVKVSAAKGGTVTVSPTEAKAGEKVTVTVTPDKGMQMVASSLKYSEGAAGGAVVSISGGSFTMPAVEVTVSCQFEVVKEVEEEDLTPRITAFLVDGTTAAINQETRRITIVMPYGTDMTQIAPSIATINADYCEPRPAEIIDLTRPQVYTLWSWGGYRVHYTVEGYVQEGTSSQRLWNRLTDEMLSDRSWWETAAYQKQTGDYELWNKVPPAPNSLSGLLGQVSGQCGRLGVDLRQATNGNVLILTPSTVSLSGSYQNFIELPRSAMRGIYDLGYRTIRYALGALEVDIAQSSKTTGTYRVTVCAPEDSIDRMWDRVQNAEERYEIQASTTSAHLTLRFDVGSVPKSRITVMKYAPTQDRFVALDRDTWGVVGSQVVTDSVSPGIYGLVIT